MTSHVKEEPVSRDGLADYFDAAARPDASSHLVGTELEKFGIVLDANRQPVPVNYADHIAKVLEQLCEQHGWRVGADRGDDGEVVELERDGQFITLEPGGQLELAGAPLPNVHETCTEFTQHYRELHEVSEPLGIAWLATGFHPFATRDDIHWMPKGRYRIMREYLPTRGSRALDMMLRTSTVQASFDYTGEAQCGERLRLSASIAPIVTAIFANSPLVEGKPSGLVSTRSRVWTDVDPDRCGIPDWFFDEPFSFERYVEWVIDVPMFFIKRDGGYVRHHKTFRRFLAEGVTDEAGHKYRPNWGDWKLHLSTVFPEVRLKPHLEFRSADAVGSKYVCALPALLVGLLYDDHAGAATRELMGDLPRERRETLWRQSTERGLADPEVRGLAAGLLREARATLERRDIRDSKGRTEARFLDPLDELVAAGTSPAHVAMHSLGQRRSPIDLAREFHFAGKEL